MTRLDHQLNDAAERLTRCTYALPDALHSLRDQLVPIRAANYDPSTQSSLQWCWRHQRDVRECERADQMCTGETFAIHDPTGEAAVTANPARSNLRRIGQLIGAIARFSDELEGRIAATRPAVVSNDRAGIGTCDGCGHYCDGVKDNRLRPVGDQRMCNRCRMRQVRRVS